jgi:hypothetical protein
MQAKCCAIYRYPWCLTISGASHPRWRAGTPPMPCCRFAAGRPRIKLSGGYIVSEHHAVDDPALDALAAGYLCAAPQRVLWGSDWPHATASSGMQPMPDDARQIDRLADWAHQNGDPPRCSACWWTTRRRCTASHPCLFITTIRRQP